MALSGSGLLSAAEMEQLIERALQQIEGRIAIDDIRALMEGVGYLDDGLNGDNVTVH
jgi:hypothetical protein